MTEAEKIAAGLSDGDAQMIREGVFSERYARLGLCWYRAADIDFDARPPAHRSARWEWRSLGLAVRAVLEGGE